MKRIIILFAALLLSFSAFAQNGKSIYQKYSDAENVSAVYVSPAMFRLIGRIPDMDMGDGKLVKKKVKEYIITIIVIDMKVIGKMIKKKEKEYIILKVVIDMKENIKMVKEKEKEK